MYKEKIEALKNIRNNMKTLLDSYEIDTDDYTRIKDMYLTISGILYSLIRFNISVLEDQG